MDTGASSGRFLLAADVHLAVVDADLVFLSLPADRYFCMAGSAANLERRPDGSLAIADGEIADELCGAGLIEPLRESRKPEPPPPWVPATSSAVRWSYPLPEPADVGDALRATLDVLHHYRGRGMQAIFAGVRPPRRGAAPPEASMLDEVDRFHRWISYAPVSGKCLLRSFMLRRLLERKGLAADWIIGVETWPFSAHCWLQAGGVVLDDTLERVMRYTPILVV